MKKKMGTYIRYIFIILSQLVFFPNFVVKLPYFCHNCQMKQFVITTARDI